MATIGLELVDAALIAVRDGQRAAASPGVALLDPQGLLVGEAAIAVARLQPVLAADRFWADLASDSQAATNGSGAGACGSRTCPPEPVVAGDRAAR